MGAGLARERVASAETLFVLPLRSRSGILPEASLPFAGWARSYNLAEGQIQPGILYSPAAGQGVLEVGLHLRRHDQEAVVFQRDHPALAAAAVGSEGEVAGGAEIIGEHPVSYTHLTLPTILRV